MRKGRWNLAVGALVAGAALTCGACQNRQSQAASASESSKASAEPTYMPSATIKDLMQSIVDVNADVVWLSVTAVSTQDGITETYPKTDEEWLKVRHGAVALAEAANLLMMPGRHVARPGEKSETPGVELEPSEMEDLINQDRATWNMRAIALHEAAQHVLAAVDARDKDRVFEVGEQIERACENCHTHYWYPNEVIPDLQISTK
jgi:hypothetical protein